MDHHVYDNRDGENKESKKNIYSNLKEIEHFNYACYSVILTTIIEEFAIECSLIILENITEPPDIHIERAIEADIDIRKTDTIRERIGISLDESREIRIASCEEDESILTRDIVDLHSGEWCRDTREELDRADLRIVIAVLEIDTDRDPIVDTRDEPVSWEYD